MGKKSRPLSERKRNRERESEKNARDEAVLGARLGAGALSWRKRSGRSGQAGGRAGRAGPAKTKRERDAGTHSQITDTDSADRESHWIDSLVRFQTDMKDM